MPSRLELLIDMLHSREDAALATLSATVPGYPLATAVSFTPDEHHRPVMLISQLAEHARSLAADARASLLVAKPLGGGEIARISLVGEVRPFEAEPRLVKRYLRFHPEAERFLQLGDFRFHRFEPNRILVVGGFGQAAWLDGKRLLDAPHLPLDQEEDLLAPARAALPGNAALLGLDAYGADVAEDGQRRRIVFAAGPALGDALLASLARAMAP